MVNSAGTEQRILKKAREVFIEDGFDGARMQRIADLAGINKAMLHYYFRSKQNLFTAVFEKVFGEVFSRILNSLENGKSLEAVIHVIIREYFDFLIDEPGLPSFVIREVNRHPEMVGPVFRQVGSTGLDRLILMVRKEQEEGRVDPDLDPRQLLLNIVSLTIFPLSVMPMLSAVFSLPEEEVRAFVRRRVDFLPDMVMKSIQP